MSIASHESREVKFQWLIRPFAWALNACLMSALFGFSLATDPTFISKDYVLAGLIISNIAVAALLCWGIVRMRASYEGRM